ncbi:MAG TPA: hypothetical protein VFJ97_02795 [Dermatophilaceae bacterium]|nr:hypothetical protein [Dermatophilaceae bacterium]
MTQAPATQQQTVTPAQARATGIPAGLTTAAAPPPPTIKARTSRAAGTVQRALAGTPGRLRLAAVASVLASLAFGLVAGLVFRNVDAGLGYAEANAAQLIRIQAINTNLMRADAAATNAFLVGGLEPAAVRADYTAAVGQATTLIAEAARAQPADGRALAALNQTLVSYTGLVESARANNRQGLPVGAQYLRIASADLRAQALPLLSNLLEANQARTTDETGAAGRQQLWLVAALLAFVAVVVISAVWLARRTKRVLNLPLTVGAVAVVAVAVAGWSLLNSVSTAVATAQRTTYQRTLDAAQARIAAFDAKSNESLTLINRGSGAAQEAAWKARAAIALAGSQAVDDGTRSTRLAPAWQRYAEVHRQVRTLDDGGDWNRAVTLATTAAATGANAAFDGYDTASGQALTAAGREFTASLADQRRLLPFLGWLGLLAGLGAAVGSWYGVSLRLEEYR